MRDLALLIVHLCSTLIRLAGPGGVRVAASLWLMSVATVAQVAHTPGEAPAPPAQEAADWEWAADGAANEETLGWTVPGQPGRVLRPPVASPSPDPRTAHPADTAETESVNEETRGWTMPGAPAAGRP